MPRNTSRNNQMAGATNRIMPRANMLSGSISVDGIKFTRHVQQLKSS
jgi:hypothetical protein